MIFFELLYTFLLIGAFTFGGGYSMIALIQGEVVAHHHWITAAEFTDLLAVSQMTPGPLGINTATYAGYTAVINAGYPASAAVCGSLLASLAVLIVPVALVMMVSGWLLKHKDHARVATVMRALRLAVVGLVAAAALSLIVPSDLLPSITALRPRIVDLVIFLAVFLLSSRKKVSPILLIIASGIVGLVVYGIT